MQGLKMRFLSEAQWTNVSIEQCRRSQPSDLESLHNSSDTAHCHLVIHQWEFCEAVSTFL